MNARYRHFWNRPIRERHFWAQFQSNVEPGYSYNPILQVGVSLTTDGPSSGASVDGAELTIGVEFEPGLHAILEPGSLEVVTTVIGGGDPTSGVDAPGATLTINTTLIQGWARFDTITVPVTIIPGEVFVPPDAFAFGPVPEPVVITLQPGTASSDVNVDGLDETVTVTIEGGIADVTLDGAAITIGVELIAGQVSVDANVDGFTFEVQSYLSQEGVATGETVNPEPPSQSARAGGPVGYQKRKEEVSRDAQAFGHNFKIGYGIASGKPQVTPDIVAPQPIDPVAEVPNENAVIDYGELPETITALLETPALVPQVMPAAEPAVVVAPKPVKPFDWIKYDNDLLELI